jgi:hypothetical protein
MSPSKSKCWYSSNCLHFLKYAVPLSNLHKTLYNILSDIFGAFHWMNFSLINSVFEKLQRIEKNDLIESLFLSPCFLILSQ